MDGELLEAFAQHLAQKIAALIVERMRIVQMRDDDEQPQVDTTQPQDGSKPEKSAKAKPIVCTGEWLSSREAAHFLRMGRSTLDAYRAKPNGPPFARMPSGAIRYRRKDLETWLITPRRSV